MNLKKTIVFITFLVYIILLFTIFINVRRSISPLNKPLIIDDTSEKADTINRINVSEPIISNGNYLYCVGEKNNQRYISIFDFEKSEINIKHNISKLDFSIYAVSKSEDNFAYLLKNQ